MKKFYVVSLLVFFGMIVATIVVNGMGIGYYANLPSLIVVVGLSAALLFATHSPREIGNAFRAAYRSSNTSELKAAIGFFKAMQRYLLWSGLLGTMMGAIAMLSALGEAIAIGAGAALGLITVLYAVILNFVLALPFRHAAEKRLAQLG